MPQSNESPKGIGLAYQILGRKACGCCFEVDEKVHMQLDADPELKIEQVKFLMLLVTRDMIRLVVRTMGIRLTGNDPAIVGLSELVAEIHLRGFELAYNQIASEEAQAEEDN